MTLSRPVPAAVSLGDGKEAQDLIKASFQRRLTADEDARLAVLTFATDGNLERGRLMVSRHPDVAAAIPTDIRQCLESYERKRQAAVDAGRVTADADARVIAEVDVMAAEYRATTIDPYLGLDNRNRAAFAAAIKAGDAAAAGSAWFGWLAEREAANAFARRRASAVQAVGCATFADVRPAPVFEEELAAAGGLGMLGSLLPPEKGA